MCRFLLFSVAVLLTLSSCVSKKSFIALQDELSAAKKDTEICNADLRLLLAKVDECEKEKSALQAQLGSSEQTTNLRQEQIVDLRAQIADLQSLRDRQMTQVGDLTILSQSANENIRETLSQLQGKDQYIKILQAAKTKTDSINLALALNLKSVLSDGIADNDVEVTVDKTVVMINLSDKMLFRSGSATITSRADEVLGKIAQIVKSRPGFDVMVEGYTDNVPIKNSCIEDNWDLSVKRSTSVVRTLQKRFGIDPNRLIAAGRGEYNTLADNSTADGRSTNRRTRIIIMPQLDEFYDLLNPEKVPK